MRDSTAAGLLRSSFTLDRAGFSVAEGGRAGLSVAAIVLLHAVLPFPFLIVTALGALLTCLADNGTPGAERVRPLLAFALLGACAGTGFALARGTGLWCAIPLAGLALFGCGLARIYGPAAMQVGNLLGVWIVLALDQPATHLLPALAFGGAFLAGSLWAMLLTSVIWRIRPSQPVLRAVAESYRAAAAMAGAIRDILGDEKAADGRSWERLGRRERRMARESLETARDMVMGLARARGINTPRIARALLRVEIIEQVFSPLTGIADLLEADETAPRATALPMLRHLRGVLLSLAQGILHDAPVDQPRLLASLAGVRADVRFLPPEEPLRRLVEVLVERLSLAATLAVPANLQPGRLTSGQPVMPLHERLSTPLRANLDWNSAALRHATVCAVAGSLALIVTLTQNKLFEHWLVITLLVTMQPYFSLTWQRMLERIGGTVLGGFVAAGLGLLVHQPLTVSLALFPLAVFAFMVRRVSFGLFLSALTPMVILLVETQIPATSELHIAVMRAIYTILGGLLAVLCSLAVWRREEPEQAGIELRRAILAHAALAEATFAGIEGEIDAPAVARARRAAGIASNNLEALLSRGMLEPQLARKGALEAALSIDAALRRMAGRLNAVHAVLGLQGPSLSAAAAREALTPWQGWIAGSLRGIADGKAPSDRPAPCAIHDALLEDALPRIARQIELIATAMARRVVNPPADGLPRPA